MNASAAIYAEPNFLGDICTVYVNGKKAGWVKKSGNDWTAYAIWGDPISSNPDKGVAVANAAAMAGVKAPAATTWEVKVYNAASGVNNLTTYTSAADALAAVLGEVGRWAADATEVNAPEWAEYAGWLIQSMPSARGAFICSCAPDERLLINVSGD
jgi:hypothetical protein